MITVAILSPDDVVQPLDWCRPLQLQTMSGGMSDSMSFKSAYGGIPENNVEWVPANRCFGNPWFKEPTTVKELIKSVGIPYEFVRGDVPRSHTLNLKGYTDLRKFKGLQDET